MQGGINIHAKLSNSNTGDYFFAAELVNNTVVRNVLPKHAMKTCGEGELQFQVLFASALHTGEWLVSAPIRFTFAGKGLGTYVYWTGSRAGP